MTDIRRTAYLRLDATNGPITGPLSIAEPAIDTTLNHTMLTLQGVKSAGVTNLSDVYTGIHVECDFDQIGGLIGQQRGQYLQTEVRNGSVYIIQGLRLYTNLAGGILDPGGLMYGFSSSTFIGTPTAFTGTIWGGHVHTWIQSGTGAITGSAYGLEIEFINNGTTSGNTIALRINESGTVSYAVYQVGTAPWRLGGKLTIGGNPVSTNYDLGLRGSGVLMLKETTTPTADTNYGKLYTKTDDKLYFQDGAGIEHQLAYV